MPRLIAMPPVKVQGPENVNVGVLVPTVTLIGPVNVLLPLKFTLGPPD